MSTSGMQTMIFIEEAFIAILADFLPIDPFSWEIEHLQTHLVYTGNNYVKRYSSWSDAAAVSSRVRPSYTGSRWRLWCCIIDFAPASVCVVFMRVVYSSTCQRLACVVWNFNAIKVHESRDVILFKARLVPQRHLAGIKWKCGRRSLQSNTWFFK